MKPLNPTFLAMGAAALVAVPVLAPALGADWSYEGANGPEKWGSLDPAYEKCSSGQMQSPIDLSEANAFGDINVLTSYRPGPLTVENKGYTVQASFAPGSRLISGTQTYELLQVHFHTSSEETLHGEAFPMIAHFVHADDGGNLAVLGVFFKEGAENDELAKIITSVPRGKSGPITVPDTAINPRRMVPLSLDVYRYQGSLTTPPCTEGVAWHIATQTLEASADQLKQMRSLMGNNARPIQPLNGRLLVAPAG